jgi:hypothetical protein
MEKIGIFLNRRMMYDAASMVTFEKKGLEGTAGIV